MFEFYPGPKDKAHRHTLAGLPSVRSVQKLCVNQAELVANCHLIGSRIFSHSLAKRVAC